MSMENSFSGFPGEPGPGIRLSGVHRGGHKETTETPRKAVHCVMDRFLIKNRAQHMRVVSSYGSNIPLKVLYSFIHEYFPKCKLS